MREIKFRALVNDQWEYYTLPQDAGYIAGRLKQKKLKHLQQFTGLLDKNGKEIYEGDIVRYSRADLEDMGERIVVEKGVGSIAWIKEVAMFGFTQPRKYGHFIMEDDTIEVIGNIYENPELLKES